MDISTRLAHAGSRTGDRFRSVSPPIYQTAIFEHERPFTEGADHYNYTRLGNPTRGVLENTLADLEGGRAAVVFSSGMAAIAAVLRLFAPGDHIIATEGLYGHTFALLSHMCAPFGIEVDFVDTSSVEEVQNAFKSHTRAVFVETPSNPLLKAADLPALASLCQEGRRRLIVDSTFLTPLHIRPLELGADIVIHSATKYLAGHNDTLAGAAIVRSQLVADELRSVRTLTGGILAPMDAWLTLRGLKTLAVRLDRAQHNALAVAEWLSQHPAVTQVHYPGLPGHAGHDILKAQASGFGSVLSFTLNSPDTSRTVLDETRLIMLAESLGGTETLITHPWSQTHPGVPEEEKRRLGIVESLLRLSVGIEAAEDLIADLDQALAKIEPGG